MKFKYEFFIILLSITILLINTKLIRKNSQKEKDQKYNNIVNWAKQNKSSFNKFEIKYLFGNNRFVVASETLQPKENISSIPIELILHDRNPLIKPTCDKYNIVDQKCISVYVCEELKNPQSFFKTFFDFLPHDYNTYPMFYDSDLLSLIKGSILEDNTNYWKNLMTNEYNELKKKNVTFSLKEYLQCRVIVWSRNFSINYDGKESSFVVPVSDLFNYNTEKVNVAWYYDEKTKAHKIDALKEIKKGDEIFVNYGIKNNVNYLFFYGFTLPVTTKSIIYEYFIKNKKIVLIAPLELVTAMNIYRTNEKEVLNSYQDEIECLNNLRSHLHNYLTAFKTNLEHDKAELAKPETKKNFNLLNVYTVLVEEKTLLTNYISLADEILTALKSDKNEIKTKLNAILQKNLSPEYLKVILAFNPK